MAGDDVNYVVNRKQLIENEDALAGYQQMWEIEPNGHEKLLRASLYSLLI